MLLSLSYCINTFTYNQGSPMDRPPGGNLGGLAGQRITLHRKKFHFCIIHIIMNKIDVNLIEKA